MMKPKAILQFGSVRLGLCLLCACLLVGQSCKSSGGSRQAEATAVTGQGDSHGYALLADLVGNEKDVAKLRFIKQERPEFKALLLEIAATNRAAYKTLEQFAKADPSLNLKDQGLPAAEVGARKAVSKYKEKAILSGKGNDLEVQLLLDQNEGLTYGSHLAQVVAQTESNPQRRQFLEQLAASLGTLQQKVVRMLLSGYRS